MEANPDSVGITDCLAHFRSADRYLLYDFGINRRYPLRLYVLCFFDGWRCSSGGEPDCSDPQTETSFKAAILCHSSLFYRTQLHHVALDGIDAENLRP